MTRVVCVESLVPASRTGSDGGYRESFVWQSAKLRWLGDWPSVSRPRSAAFVAASDAPRIGERTAGATQRKAAMSTAVKRAFSVRVQPRNRSTRLRSTTTANDATRDAHADR